MALIVSRIHRGQDRRAQEDAATELLGFGVVFIREAVDVTWALERLAEVLAITGGRIDGSYRVVKRLMELAPDYPGLTLDSLERLARADREGRSVRTGLPEMRDALNGMTQHSDESVRRRAREFIDYLGSIGFHDFGDLVR